MARVKKKVGGDEKYIRVATTLYKIVQQPDVNGGFMERRMVWTYETFKQDNGSGALAEIPKYDGFCCIPEHLHYQPVVGNFLNLYDPILYRPKQGDCPLSLSLIQHIFGEQYELGLDYIQLLYMYPIQKLPILLLVSKERNTGKSTFLNFLKVIFQGNMTFNTNEAFRSQFNSDWAGKLIIAVDEVLLDRRDDSERLKNLSTALTYKIEAKGRDRYEIPFFAKFILCSNNESLPVLIDVGEIRYWVRKISVLEHDDTGFLEKLKAEIPSFLYFIQNRELSTQRDSRMWFTSKLIHTVALQKIIRNGRNQLEQELSELFLEIMDTFRIDKISFCCKDVLAWLEHARIKANNSLIRKILQEEWGLEPVCNTLIYTMYKCDCKSPKRYSTQKATGRFYTVTRDILTRFDEMMK